MLFRRSAILLAAGLVIGGTAGVQAADLGGGSVKDAMPMAAPSPTWYFRIDGGYAVHNDPSISDRENYAIFTREDLDNTWTLGAGIGKYFGNSWRGDITVDYRFGADVSSTVYPAPPGLFETDLRSTVVLANIYYDFNRGTRFTPYIGAGIGFVNHRMGSTSITACSCDLDVKSHSDNDFAVAGMAGFTWNLGRRQEVVGSTKDGPVYVESDRGWKIDFGYRLLYLGDAETGRVIDTGDSSTFSRGFKVEDIVAHEFRIGLRYDFR